MSRACKTCGCDISMHHRLRRYCIDCGPGRERVTGATAAHAEVARAVARGLLPRPNTMVCADCGDPAEVYDHRDYAKPLEVEAVCQLCNQRRGPAKYVANQREAA